MPRLTKPAEIADDVIGIMPTADELRAAVAMEAERSELDALHAGGAFAAVLDSLPDRKKRRTQAVRLFNQLTRGHLLFIRHGTLAVEPPVTDGNLAIRIAEYRADLEGLCDERDGNPELVIAHSGLDSPEHQRFPDAQRGG